MFGSVIIVGSIVVVVGTLVVSVFFILVVRSWEL